MPILRHYDDMGTVRFVTFSCYRRLPDLNHPSAKPILIEEIANARNKHGFLLFGYVLMPEHVHLVLLPPARMKLGSVIGEIKSHSARRFFSSTGSRPDTVNVFWQKRCYDHNCRNLESVWEKINYCHNNPVKRGLVCNPSEWQWSSYNWYRGERDVPLIMDPMGI
ncbi:MAG: transposase [Candidatus Zixiibacteriota bacterium]|nr:MAG: transposase [candidate division Zixibacteria bacterium]